MPRFIDLHSHSTASDGTLSPADVVRLAAKRDLAALALTDHDTVAGLAEARREAEKLGIDFVDGLELSVDANWGHFHMLGYFVDPENETLLRRLAELRRGRDERNPRIVRKLNALGIDVTMEEVEREAHGGEDIAGKAVARPHIAAVLVKKGVVGSIKEAFDKFLAEGRPAYSVRPRLEVRAAVSMIREAGGLAVMAHPVTVPASVRERAVRHVAESHVVGIEAWHPKQDETVEREVLGWAEKLDLVATGGSDFHGTNKPDVDLGTGKGRLRVPVDVLARLRFRLT